MTVTIIGEDPTFKKDISCPICASKLSYSAHDVRIDEGGPENKLGHLDPKKWIVCVKCTNPVIISNPSTNS